MEPIVMTNGSATTLKELDDRIAIVRDNIRQLIEQAAANAGAGDEARNADRLAQQQAELDRLTKEREALLKTKTYGRHGPVGTTRRN
jgi:enolase